jgi:hypothetical protein
VKNLNFITGFPSHGGLDMSMAGIDPPEIRRYAATCIERTKQITDQRNPMYGYLEPQRRLKLRRSFIAKTNMIQDPPTRPDYVNGKKNYELKYLCHLMNDFPQAETNYGPYGKQ